MTGVLLAIVFGLITAYCAQRKGYNPRCWILSGGLIGLAVWAELWNHMRDASFSDDNERNAYIKEQDKTGTIMSITVILWVILSVVLRFTMTGQ
jgi:hypothetical protein